VPGRFAPGESLELTGGDARKIITVLRKKTGDAVEIIDSAAQRFAATLEIDNRRVTAMLGEAIAGVSNGRLKLCVAQAVPKGQKMDFVIEKLTELGVAEILPFYSERSVVEDTGVAKLERWRRLAQSAAQQCGRDTLPVIRDPQRFADIVARFPDYDTVLFPWELAESGPLRERLPALVEHSGPVLMLIGPEGGFSSDEAAAAQAAGAHLISLGSRILRTETAALVLASILNYLD
jgi:16S rRNA (uracil1498-N3)-methyltransferase